MGRTTGAEPLRRTAAKADAAPTLRRPNGREHGRPPGLLELQALAGNRAVVSLVAAGSGAAGVISRKKSGKPSGKGKTIPRGDKARLEGLAAKGSGGEFRKLATQIHGTHPDQFVALLAYKLTKHGDAGNNKQAYWKGYSPPDAVEAALASMDEFTKADDDGRDAKLTLAVSTNDKPSMAAFYKQDPNAYVEIVAAKLSADGDGRGLASWCTSLPPAGMVAVARRMGASDFLTKGLDRMRTDLAITEVVKNHDLMNYLEAAAPGPFATFRSSMPQLEVMHQGRSTAAVIGRLDKASVVQAVFLAFVGNLGIDLTYYTNALDPDLAILTGTRNQAMFDAQREVIAKVGKAPTKPATQCHNLLNVLKSIMATVPGENLTITSQHVGGMLLTAPLSGLPDGLIDKGFNGNVFDDSGAPTGQVFFSGNDEGQQSHTWLVIDGVPFDPVMGTMGDEVLAAKNGEFEWVVGQQGKVAKEKGGVRSIVKEKGLAATTNHHGFGSGYRLTTTPDRYLT